MDIESEKRRVSVITQIDPHSFKELSENGNLSRTESDNKMYDGNTYRRGSRKLTTTLNHLALFKDDEIHPPHGHTTFFSPYITPGPGERAQSEKKKANLGVMLGVYLPTIQHILGVTMFIRLFWVVGIAGVPHTMILLFLCCSCTLLTSISLSAVATNGIVESGGSYFMISRNLGAEFGSAVGILFYLANTVATSMYLVGGVEVMLLYIFPNLTIGGEEVHGDTSVWGMMSHNYRIYGTLFLLLEVLICAMGVKFVQLLAPISLGCVILSILACFGGGIEKAVTHSGLHVCMLNQQLLPTKIFLPDHAPLSDVCKYCIKSEGLSDDFCQNETETLFCSHFAAGNLKCINAFPGINATILASNMVSMYMKAGESLPDIKADVGLEVFQDVDTTFFVLLAIYFPAVTGIFTGTNMSGDLKDPQKSIPFGTIAATLSTSFIYYALAILFGASIPGPVLRDKYGKSLASSLVVASLSWPSPWVVIIGSFLSTFGAALQCLCSAPRLLQSIAKDDVIPFLRPFARVTSKNEPFLGLLFTAFIAEFAILLGAVDAIAEVLDFFFLMCYASVNLICALHSLMKAPNWRPRFRYYHWSLSLLGAFLCFFIMFSSRWQYALISIFLTMTIYKYVEWKGAKKEWGDGIRGLALTTAQVSLLNVEDKDPHPKNWRPQLLIMLNSYMSKDIIDMRSLSLLHLASQLKAGRGLAMVVTLINGDPGKKEDKKKANDIKVRLQKDIEETRLKGFAKTLIYFKDQVPGCISALFQSVGIGGLKPNTVLINFPKTQGKFQFTEKDLFAEELLKGSNSEYCILIAKGITDFPSNDEKLRGNVDIWWMAEDGGILMLMAFLLSQNKIWKGCTLRVLLIANSFKGNTKDIQKQFEKFVYLLRVDAKVYIVDQKTPDSSDNNSLNKTDINDEKKDNSFSNNSTPKKEGYNNVTFTKETDEIQIDLGSPYDSNESENERDSTMNFKMNENLGCNHKIREAMMLNNIICETSNDSQLVLLSLPKIPRNKDQIIDDYITYLNILTMKLPRVLLIGGSGKEVVAITS
ncbi:Amino acid permease/ SLC12A domain-containing protein [Strongyloides ratti]|uniref:Amino acid permease/ SLC12A domain-containing protein n=1 Tax=Strongyloides ratti TaxID=34506 RepID=A0A090KWR2_STRRB|nr:Amino acid permease/ SLC12A domain-containing protein [Strongyloides ratti]CEF60292.1 Amino acid permease/ SLC12A domain-containing protein [Strongyloides ratti]